MPSHPLTHHEILTLVEPFTRHGYRADLQASDRLQRKLVFKPRERETTIEGEVKETLHLENRDGNLFRLTRTLLCTTPSDRQLEAEVSIEGTCLGDLLTCVETVQPERQFRFGPGFKVAKSYRLIRGSGSTSDGAPVVGRVLTKMSAYLGDLVVTATAPRVKTDPEAVIEIEPTAGDFKTVPDDLLAVLGWDWGLMKHRKNVWKSSLRLRGREPQRSQRAETKLEGMVDHLVQTFAEAPARFHERLARERWGVAFRRSLPLLIGIALIAGAVASARLPLAEDSPIRMMMMNLPGFLMIFAFCMRRLPVIEVPPLPRRPKERAWREVVPDAAVT